MHPPSGNGAGLERLRQVILASPTRLEKVCSELAGAFSVREHEVAVFWLDRTMLRFLFPVALQAAGAIPLTGKAVVARTATSQRSELFNNFPRVQHNSLYEKINLREEEENVATQDPMTIQKLMSVPIRNATGETIGVVQVSRKGFSLISAGPDFRPEDLHRLEVAAEMIGSILPRLAASWGR